MAVQLDKGTSLFSLSLTPLVDVVFLLLIFFLVATEFAREEERQMDLLLPEASEAQPLTTRPREMFVNVDDEGRYSLRRVPKFQRETDTDVAVVPVPLAVALDHHRDARTKRAGQELRRRRPPIPASLLLGHVAGDFMSAHADIELQSVLPGDGDEVHGTALTVR